MKHLRSVLALVAALLLLMAGSVNGATLKEAPLNPKFIDFMMEYLQGTYSAATPEGFALGYIPPPVDVQALNAGQPHPLEAEAAALPAAFDWRTSPGYNAVTSVKDQKSCGSCWSFANMGAIESNYRILVSHNAGINLSENNMIDIRDSGANKYCHWPWLWSRCIGGHTLLATSYLTGLVKRGRSLNFQKGALTETKDPYKSSETFQNTKCSATSRPLPQRLINGTRWLSNDATVMKNAIYAKGPIVTAYYAESPGSPHWYNNNTVYHYPGCTSDHNHEVLIIGWDDNKTWPGGGGKGAWLIKNSWGNFNSMGGCFWLTYGSANVGDDGMYYTTTRAYQSKENLYMEDLPGWITLVGCGGNVAFGAVVFAPLNTGEKLTRVEFFSPFNNMPYTIKVWRTVKGTDSVTFTGLQKTVTGTCEEAGYYSIYIPVPTPVLTKGRRYGVEVKFTDPTELGYPIPTGRPINGVVDTYVGSDGTNATTYYRCNNTGAFFRTVVAGTTYTPNVRALTTR